MNTESPLRVVIFRECDAWAAQCVDYDIGAQAPTPEILFQRFAMAVDANYNISRDRTGKAFGGIDKAPAHFEEMWSRRAGELTPTIDRCTHPMNLALCA